MLACYLAFMLLLLGISLGTWRHGSTEAAASAAAPLLFVLVLVSIVVSHRVLVSLVVVPNLTINGDLIERVTLFFVGKMFVLKDCLKSKFSQGLRSNVRTKILC